MTSSGELQIVQVHKTDSGTYVCVADNGIGEPVQREIRLDIAGKFCENLFNGVCYAQFNIFLCLSI